jgi:hypothetical protein
MQDVGAIQQATCIKDDEIDAEDLPQSSTPTLLEQHVERLNNTHRKEDQAWIDAQPPPVYETWDHHLQAPGISHSFVEKYTPPPRHIDDNPENDL